MANMASKVCGRLIVSLHGRETPSHEEWAAHLVRCSAFKEGLGNDLSRGASLAFSDGGAPNAQQRAGLKELLKAQTVRAAIVTEDPLARGVVTIMSWFSPGFRAFAPAEWRQAFDYTSVTPAEEAQVRATLRELQAEVGTTQVLGRLLGPGVGQARTG